MAETPLLDIVRDYMKNDEWPIEELDDVTAIRSGFQGDEGKWSFVVRTHEDDQAVLAYSILVNNVPEQFRDEVALFMTRANYGMRIGNFEMDMADGEVRYKTSIDVEGGQLTRTMVHNLVGLNVTTMNRYYMGLNKVMFGGANAQDAIAEIEG